MVTRKKKSVSPSGKKNRGKKQTVSAGAGKPGKKDPVVELEAITDDSNKIEAVTVTLEPVITISEVAEVRKKLLENINAGELRIDAAKVKHIDTAGLQLLLALSGAFRNTGRRIEWLAWSGACKHTAGLLGLTKTLEIKDI